MRVSIVVPAYNSRRYLAQTVASVTRQTLTDWEMVVVDDGSSDGTYEMAQGLAEGDPRIRAFRQANQGTSAARNAGVDWSAPSAPFLMFLDNDDILERDALEALVGALEANPLAPAAHGVSRFIDSDGNPCRPEEGERLTRQRRAVTGRRRTPWPVDQPTTFATLAVENCIWSPGQALIRRSALSAVGPFDTSYFGVGDWDMWLRLALKGDLAFLDRVTLNYRLHATNASRDCDRMQRDVLRLYAKFLLLPGLTRAQWQAVRVSRDVTLRRPFYTDTHWQARWAGDAIRKGEVVSAARYLGLALRSYVRALRAPLWAGHGAPNDETPMRSRPGL